MGSIRIRDILILCALLWVFAALFFLTKNFNESRLAVSRSSLLQNFIKIGSWSAQQDSNMEQMIINALDLDDYLLRSYRSGNDQLTLYIGFYNSAQKVGAAHDPLVCFQGQGWHIDHRQKVRIDLPTKPAYRLQTSLMTAENEDNLQMALYWFQADDHALADTLSQKFFIFWNKLIGKGEANAFVRITSAFKKGEEALVEKKLRDFVNEFYPAFYEYITAKEKVN